MDLLSLIFAAALAVGTGGGATIPTDTPNIRSTIIDTGAQTNSNPVSPPPTTFDIRSTIIDTGGN